MFSKRNIVLILFVILINSKIGIDFITRYKTNKFVTSVESLNNYEGCSKTEIINNLELSDNIINRDEIIDKINKASFKIYEDKIIYKEKDYAGFYYHDDSHNNDYIVLDTMLSNSLTFRHEIGHLIYEYQVLKEEVDIYEVLKDTVKGEDYIKFFESFPKISTEDHSDSLDYGEILFMIYSDDVDYYYSRKEIHARLFSYYAFSKHIEAQNLDDVLGAIESILIDNDMTRFSIQTIDFLIILPLIDFDQEEKLKLLF